MLQSPGIAAKSVDYKMQKTWETHLCLSSTQVFALPPMTDKQRRQPTPVYNMPSRE